VGLAEDLGALFELQQKGAISQIEFQEIKTKMIKDNLQDAAKIATQFSGRKGGTNPLQIAAIAASASIGSRLVLDHLKNDSALKKQVETLQEQVSDLNSGDGFEITEVTSVQYESGTDDVDLGFDFS